MNLGSGSIYVKQYEHNIWGDEKNTWLGPELMIA